MKIIKTKLKDSFILKGKIFYDKRGFLREAYKKKVDIAFLGAWNFKEEIFKKEKNFIKKGGKFITHVPIPKII